MNKEKILPSFCARLMIVLLLSLHAHVSAEDWYLFEGNNLATNSSKVTIPAGPLKKNWQRRFANPQGNPNEYKTSRYSSYNLVTNGDYLAVVAADDGIQLGLDDHTAYISILKRATGETVNCIQVPQEMGFPIFSGSSWTNLFYQGTDIPTNHTILAWDPSTDILYAKQGGDVNHSVAVKPFANLSNWTPGTWQEAVHAYEEFNPRPSRPGATEKWMDRQHNMGTIQPNDAAFLAIDPDFPFIYEAGMGHDKGSKGSMWNKFTGVETVGPHNLTPLVSGVPSSSVFAIPSINYKGVTYTLNDPLNWFTGALVDNGRVYTIYAGSDYDGDRKLGGSAQDQGLTLVAHNIVPQDAVNNGYGGLAELDSATESVAFAHLYESDADALNLPNGSYYEHDFDHINKAMIVDQRFNGCWVAWKPGVARTAQLVYGDDNRTFSYDLGVAGGLKGTDFTPKMSLVQASNGRTYLVYLVVPDIYLGYIWNTRLKDGSTHDIEMVVMDVTDPASVTRSYIAPVVAATEAFHPLRSGILRMQLTDLVVAGDVAYVAFMDNTVAKSNLVTLAFDVKATGNPPTPVINSVDLGISNAMGSCILDSAAVDGNLLFWISENNAYDPDDEMYLFSRRIFQSNAYHLVSLSSSFIPDLKILNPVTPDVLKLGQSVNLAAQAIDTQYGNISSSIIWTSDLDGYLGTGASLQVTLSKGVHRIKASVENASAKMDQESVEITVTGGTVYQIQFNAGSNGTLAGSVSQTVDAFSNSTAVTAVPNPGYFFDRWTGDYTGSENPLVLNRVNSNKTIFPVFRPLVGTPPTVAITSFENGAIYSDSEMLVLEAEVSDPDTNPTIPDPSVDFAEYLALRLGQFVRWHSDKDGELGVGYIGLDTAKLSSGHHEITATARDAQGHVVSTKKNIFIGPRTGPRFVESGGIVAIEAEHFTGIIPGSWPAKMSYWDVKQVASASNGETLIAGPAHASGLNASNLSKGPRVYYDIKFTTTGKYAAHVLLRGGYEARYLTSVTSNNPVKFTPPNTGSNFVWMTKNSTGSPELNITTPGVYKIGFLWIKPGTEIDKIVLKRLDDTAPIGAGPAESTIEADTGFAITAPKDGHSSIVGQSVTFSGYANNYLSGEASGVISWSSNRDGNLGNGQNIQTSSLSAGVHTITASFSDGVEIKTDSLVITIAESPLPSIYYSASALAESSQNDGTIDDYLDIHLVNDTFTADALSSGYVQVSNVPSGLTASLQRIDSQRLRLFLQGAATFHADENDVTNLSVQIGNQALTSHSIAGVSGATRSDLAIDFSNPTITYTLQENPTEGGTIESIGFTTVPAGTPLIVRAQSLPGWSFKNWTTSGGIIANVNAATTSVTSFSNATITAVFETLPILSVIANQPIQEGQEDGKTLMVTLANGTFASELNKDDWILSDHLGDVTVGSVNRLSDTSALLVLNGNRTRDYDANITTLSLTILPNQITGLTREITQTISATFVANNDPEILEISDDGWILGAAENGEQIMVMLEGGTFAETLNKASWTLSSAPTGVLIGSLERINEKAVRLTLAGNSSGTGSNLICGLTIGTSEIDDRDTPLTASGSITIQANDLLVEFQQGVQGYDGCSNTTLRSQNPNNNYKHLLEVRGASPENKGFIKFELDSLPPGTEIESAQLVIYLSAGIIGDPVYLYPIVESWDEATATWNNASAKVGSTLLASYTLPPTASFRTLNMNLEGDALALVQQWIDNPSTNFGFALVGSAATSDIWMGTKLNSDLAKRPKLILTRASIDGSEINLMGNNISILKGDSTPTLLDGTDFGQSVISGGSSVHSFSLKNFGNQTLVLSGTPLITISGAHAADFVVSSQPTATVAAGGSTSFEITFNPSTGGERNALVSIQSNDADEAVYTFAIKGTGIDQTLTIVTESEALTVSEGGTATIGVKLNSAPISDVTVSVSRMLGDSDLIVENGASLTFTPGNWSSYQSVTIRSNEDDADSANGSALFQLLSGSAVGATFTAHENDDDVTIRIQVSGSGSVSPFGNIVREISSMPIQLTANEESTSSFINWSGDTSGLASITAASTTLHTGTDVVLTANFETHVYSLSYLLNNGRISGISFQNVSYGLSGSPVTVIPDLGYRFVRWDDGSTDITRTDAGITMNTTLNAILESSVPPVITEGSAISVVMSEDSSPIAFNLTLNATDADDAENTLTWSIPTQGSVGVASLSGSGAMVRVNYVPSVNAHGSDTFEVKVADPTGASDIIVVHVNIQSVADAPIVNAGQDVSVQLPAYALLDASVSDPDGDPVEVLWTKVSGPGSVNFADDRVIDTIAEFSEPGTYRLSLSASDGVNAASDEVVVTVTSSYSLLVKEGFNYPVGSNLIINPTSGTGTTRWFEPQSWHNQSTIASGSLTHAGLNGSVGGKLVNNNSADNYNTLELGRTYGIIGGVPSHSVLWMSFLVQSNGSDAVLSMLLNGSSNVASDGSGNVTIDNLDAGSALKFASAVTGYPTTTAPISSSGATQWVVVRFAFTAGSNAFHLWVNPTIGATEPTLASAHCVATGRENWSFNQLQILVRKTGTPNANAFYMDDIRFAERWTELAGVVENQPPTVVLNASGGLGELQQAATQYVKATAKDFEDGDISSSVAWVSSLDGAMGTGSRLATNILSIGTHTLTATITDSGGLTRSDSINLKVTAGTTVIDYDYWASNISWGGFNSSNLADPDRDGMANLLEYAFGSDPLIANSPPAVASYVSGQLRLSFKRYLDRSDISYIVEVTDDLSTWTTIASCSGSDASMTTQNHGQIISETTTGDEVSVVIGDDPANSSTKRFMRIRVSSNN